MTQARTNLAGHACRHKVVFDRGFWAGVDGWWLEQRRLTFVVPAKNNMAATGDARAQAAAAAGMARGRRTHTGRHGQGKTAWTERLETAVVGITGRTTDDQDGTPAPGRTHTRRDVQPHLSTAVVGRQGNGHASGPAGKPVFLTTAAVDHPVRPVDDDDDRRLLETCGLEESTQPGSLKPPPQKTARAVRVHVLLTWLLCALATADRWHGEPEDPGGEPVGWQRWRRRLLERTPDLVSVLAQGDDGLVHRAESSLLVGVTSNDRPPGIGTRPQILAKYRLTARG